MRTRVILIDLERDFDSQAFSRQHAADLYAREEEVEIWRADGLVGGEREAIDRLWGGWPREVGGKNGVLINDMLDEVGHLDSLAASGEARVGALAFGLIYAHASEALRSPRLSPDQIGELRARAETLRRHESGREGDRLAVRCLLLALTGADEPTEIAAAERLTGGAEACLDGAIFVNNQPQGTHDAHPAQISGLRAAIDILRSPDALRMFADTPVIGLAAPSAAATAPDRFARLVRARILGGLRVEEQGDDAGFREIIDDALRLVDEVTEPPSIPRASPSWPENLTRALWFGTDLPARTEAAAKAVEKEVYEALSAAMADQVAAQRDERATTTRDARIRDLQRQAREDRSGGLGGVNPQIARLRDRRAALIERQRETRATLLGRLRPLTDQAENAAWLRAVAANFNEQGAYEQALDAARKAAGELPRAGAFIGLIVVTGLIYYLPRVVEIVSRGDLDAVALPAALGYDGSVGNWAVFAGFYVPFLIVAIVRLRAAARRRRESFGALRAALDALAERLHAAIRNATDRANASIAAHWLQELEQTLRARSDEEARDALRDAVARLGDPGPAPEPEATGGVDGPLRSRLSTALALPAREPEPPRMILDMQWARTQPIACPTSFYLEPDRRVAVQPLTAGAAT